MWLPSKRFTGCSDFLFVLVRFFPRDSPFTPFMVTLKRTLRLSWFWVDLALLFDGEIVLCAVLPPLPRWILIWTFFFFCCVWGCWVLFFFLGWSFLFCCFLGRLFLLCCFLGCSFDWDFFWESINVSLPDTFCALLVFLRRRLR
ncbi:hypothetical protein H257_03420 [Aphanomyces astaci]|uniref:Uncharacterized protein n=1 Tax=Aphanomyces astaci TaxID=112090 RepID=W4GWM7_APHAT|nr:hypothetical protein H257_03420 [Aphanomyces astaci]ETV84110.1 hypothetical protein H257_03420 [Aphanomyces astaci]|eukprot:XP_009825802.1 hypothetical protein H257_03420 [Aphanomyces astaci]